VIALNFNGDGIHAAAFLVTGGNSGDAFVDA
jgi:hypothetical protein